MDTTSKNSRTDTKKSKKPQQGSPGGDKKETRGYMAIYHDIEEMSYGPMCGLPAIARVFLCIRHKLLRDGLGQKSIGHSFVMEKTHLTKAQVINSAKKLEKNGLIIIKTDCKEVANGRVQYFENKYELNPIIFGDDINWYKNNPTVRVYSNNKVGSYSWKGVYPSGIESDTGGGIESDTGVVSNLISGRTLMLTELLDKALPNNPSSNNLNKNPRFSGSEIGESFTLPGESKSRQLQDPEAEKNRQIDAAKRMGIL